MRKVSAFVNRAGELSGLIASTNANEAWEVLESEETRDYNYFLEVDGEPAEG